MRIAISALTVCRNDFGGGERYLYFLIRHLAEIDHKNEYFIFVSPLNKDRFAVDNNNFRIIVCPLATNNRIGRILYEQFFLRRLLRKYKIDVFHNPYNILPLLSPPKSVMTIQAIANFAAPHYYRPVCKRWCVNKLMEISAKKAVKIISASYDNKYKITEHLNVPKDKVLVVYHGCDDDYRKIENIEEVEKFKNKVGIKGGYILCVSNNFLHKNLEGLCEAFHYIKEKYGVTHKLVIAGNEGFSRRRRDWLKRIRSEISGIVHLGYLRHEDLRYLYNGADVFVLPSFCESFGMPLIEAMACGVPIVTSNIFAMPEIVGEAGLKVDPSNFREIGEAIYTLLTNEVMKRDLINKGFERVKLFTWQKTARETLKVFEETYNAA